MGATETAPTGLDDLAAHIAAERPRLVRLCTAITRNPFAAEDLAHETLFEALQRRDRLHDPAGLPLWLNAIARHVCARWLRSHGREQARAAHDEAAAQAVPDEW
ncbi:MAG TPA: sigma factor, partial [Roseiflexaceae bacterium]|nr:sigma factor [Roseiflexaceae bacterium]